MPRFRINTARELTQRQNCPSPVTVLSEYGTYRGAILSVAIVYSPNPASNRFDHDLICQIYGVCLMKRKGRGHTDGKMLARRGGRWRGGGARPTGSGKSRWSWRGRRPFWTSRGVGASWGYPSFGGIS